MENCNEEQKKFIITPLNHCKLLGIPGGGKTSTIIKKILHHMDLKEINQHNFLIVTFSRKACSDFIERGASISNQPNLFSPKNVKTIHSLAGCISTKLNNKSCSSLEIIISSVIKILNEASQEDIMSVGCLSKLKLIFVDEAQDISNSQYELINLISTKLNAYLILVGDPNQNIYQFQNGSDKYLLNHPGEEHILVKNHRSSKEIVDIVNLFRPWKLKMPEMVSISGPSNIKPIIYIGNTNSFIQQAILREIRDNKYKPEEIAIIGPVKICKLDKYGKYKNIGLQLIVNLLEENNIKYLKHYNDTTKDAEIVNEDKKIMKDHINIYTIHGSKGLEFKKVILLNFHFSTYGILPTIEDYNKYRYLWYVGLSRAKEKLVIMVDREKNIWWDPEFRDNKHLFTFIGSAPTFEKPKFGNLPNLNLGITDLLRTKEIFSEEVLHYLHDNINFISCETQLFETPIEYNNFNELSSIYGSFVEKIVEYYYSLIYKTPYNFIKKVKRCQENSLIIDEKFSTGINNIYNIINYNKEELTTLNLLDLYKYKNKFIGEERLVFEYLSRQLEHDTNKNFFIQIKNSNIYYDDAYIINLCKKIEENLEDENNIYYIFEISLYLHQINYEAKYLWSKRQEIYNSIKENLLILFTNIKQYIGSLNSVLEFQVPVRSSYIEGLNGIIDAYDYTNKKIIEYKFVKNISLLHILQIFIYNIMLNPNWKKLDEMEIINLYDGTSYKIYIKPIINHFEFLNKLVSIIKPFKEDIYISNIVLLYDLETTGLIENNKMPEIIERHFYEPFLDLTIDDGLVKPKNINEVRQFILDLTHITREDLETGEEYLMFANNFRNKFKYCHKPTLIAHNGNLFDHVVMRHNNLFNIYYKLLDSMIIIPNFYKIKTSKRLTSLYQEITNKNPYNAHRAGADVMMMHDIFESLDLYNKLFHFQKINNHIIYSNKFMSYENLLFMSYHMEN
jgi:hypothetical protein